MIDRLNFKQKRKLRVTARVQGTMKRSEHDERVIPSRKRGRENIKVHGVL